VSKGSPTGEGETERYMRRLADGLDALSGADRAEVLAEIRSHLGEATEEAGGDETKALAAFGSPDEMAIHLLQERGVIVENRGLPEVPGWMRWAAVAIDAARWLVLLCLLLFVPFGVAAYAGGLVMAASWAYVAVVAAGTVWWWGWRRRRRGYVTAGMSIMGLRRVRVAGATRVVRSADVGEPRRGKGELIGSIAWAALIALVVGVFAYGAIGSVVGNSAANHQQEIQDVAQDVLDAERAVDNVYGAALKGDSASDWFASQAASAGSDLLARAASGAFDGYDIDRVQLPDYKPMPFDSDELARYSVVVVIDVTETRNNIGLLTYEYRVVKHITDLQVSGPGMAFSWTWRIEQVIRVSDSGGA
jgi:hypothetical protein